jgi:hypothetical protein
LFLVCAVKADEFDNDSSDKNERECSDKANDKKFFRETVHYSLEEEVVDKCGKCS